MSEIYMCITCVLIVLLFISRLFSLSQKTTSGKARLVHSLVDLVLITLCTMLVLYIFLALSSMVQAFVPAATAVLCGSLMAAVKLVVGFLLERKRTLTDQQKSELMDL